MKRLVCTKRIHVRERREVSGVRPGPVNWLRPCEGQVQWGVQADQREAPWAWITQLSSAQGRAEGVTDRGRAHPEPLCTESS